MVTQYLTERCTMPSPTVPLQATTENVASATSPQPTQIDSVSSQIDSVSSQVDSVSSNCSGFVSSNTGCSNFVSSSSSPSGGQGSPQPCKRPGETRRSNKPIMEKKRRARINNCLNELKSLILDAMKKDPARHSKLEKADILEMTVKHLETMQRQQTAMTAATDPQILNKFRAGFSECAGEVGRFPGLEPPVRRRLLQHLANVLNTSTGTEGTSSPNSANATSTPQATTTSTSTPGLLQVHILPAVTTESATQNMPLVTQQSILFSTSSNGGPSLHLVPTRLPNGDIALVLPSPTPSTMSPNQVNINNTNRLGSINKQIVTTACGTATTTTSGTVVMSAASVVPAVLPSALSPLPMLIPISTRSNTQQTVVWSPTSTSCSTSSTPTVSSTSSTNNATSTHFAAPSKNDSQTRSTVEVIPSGTPISVQCRTTSTNSATSTVEVIPSGTPISVQCRTISPFSSRTDTVGMDPSDASVVGVNCSVDRLGAQTISHALPQSLSLNPTIRAHSTVSPLRSTTPEVEVDPRNPSSSGINYVPDRFSSPAISCSSLSLSSPISVQCRIGSPFSSTTDTVGVDPSDVSVVGLHYGRDKRTAPSAFSPSLVTTSSAPLSRVVSPVGVSHGVEKRLCAVGPESRHVQLSTKLAEVECQQSRSSLLRNEDVINHHQSQPDRVPKSVYFSVSTQMSPNHEDVPNHQYHLEPHKMQSTFVIPTQMSPFVSQGQGMHSEQSPYMSPPMTTALSLVVRKTVDDEIGDEMPWRPW